MKRFLRRSFGTVFLGTVLAISMASSAWAAPLAPARDRSDNGIFFTYDAETGEMPEYGSATTITYRDRVDIQLAVELAPEGSEAPLISEISLKLKGAKAVRYRGNFTVKVRDLFTDEPVASVVIPVDVVLRPLTGKRRALLTAPLDLPGGDYEAKAIFRAGS
ncbi:MAG TPA: hypothetical protein VJ927_03535 [Actinomycetota bacterium]|nr:hypothetical protein [Actinomycetota bacterium]